jgi:hypothetical protein
MAAESADGYSGFMNRNRLFLTPNQAALVLGATLLVTLTGCVGYVDRPAQGSVYVEPNATFAVQDDYVYYPNYECYYSVSRNQYAYREGNTWVARPAPRGVTVNVLRASPSVKMEFHDSPANHHAAVAKQYPKNWKDNQPGGNNGH